MIIEKKKGTIAHVNFGYSDRVFVCVCVYMCVCHERS